MIIFYFFNRAMWGIGSWGHLFLFTLFVIIPTIICIRQVKKPDQRNVKIIMGISGFCLSYIAVLGWFFCKVFGQMLQIQNNVYIVAGKC